jgi:hypothetical protein
MHRILIYQSSNINREDESMGTLTRLIKTLIWAAILDRVVKEAIMVGLMKSVSWVLRPSTGSIMGALMSRLFPITKGSIRPGYIQALLKSVLAVVLLRSMNRSELALPAIISAAGALLLSLIGSKEERQEHNDRVIDLDEYTVVDEV